MQGKRQGLFQGWLICLCRDPYLFTVNVLIYASGFSAAFPGKPEQSDLSPLSSPPTTPTPHTGEGNNWQPCSSPTLTLSQHHGRMCGLLSAPVGRETIGSSAPAHQGEGEKLLALPQPPRRYQPSRRKAGTGDLFRLSCRKSCLRMPHSPDRTATTTKLVYPNQSVVPVHFSGIPPCPIRLRVPHPSSFPKESGIGRPGTAGQSTVCQSGKRGVVPLLPPHPDPPPPVGRETIGGPAPPPP
jgi:hypothetical protein